MKKEFRTPILGIVLVSLLLAGCREPAPSAVEQSYFKLTSSNGLIAAIYNAQENRIDDVYPHIFAQIDSSTYVYPFVGNITVNTDAVPRETGYLENTHVIQVKYDDFTLNYLASFTESDKVFYIVARGKKEAVEGLTYEAQTEEGEAVHGITLLENHMQDLPIHIAGNALTGSTTKEYDDGTFEKYFLFSFTDDLHTDREVISRAIARIDASEYSLVDDEVDYMKGLFANCSMPEQITEAERNIVEQSITVLKMSQVSEAEIVPKSHGQVLAAIRPGLWHVCWVRDGSFAIEAMTRLGMYDEARKALEFMLNADAGRFKNYVHTDGKDYGPGVDYQVSLTRYFGNGTEECDYNDDGPNIEYDDFGLFLTAFSDYVIRSGDQEFYMKWNEIMSTKVADPTVHIIESDSLVKQDSGPWEHHLALTKKYTFTSGVCARGLELFAGLQEKYGLPFETYRDAAGAIRGGMMKHMLVEGRYFKGNKNDMSTEDHEYYDAGAFEIFANGLITDKDLFLSHMEEYDKVLRIPGPRAGYIRLQGNDPYENQEWVFINLRIALAYKHFGMKEQSAAMIGFITRQATANYNIIPEMLSNKEQMAKVPGDYDSWNTWCNCIREESDQYIGTIPMVGYGSGAYVLALFEYYGEEGE